MYETYPKGKGGLPAERKPKSDKTDSVYIARARVGETEETRMRNLHRNDYGKKPQKEDEFDGGIRVNPRRTQISSAGGLVHGHR
jgi:hypothetical protein